MCNEINYNLEHPIVGLDEEANILLRRLTELYIEEGQLCASVKLPCYHSRFFLDELAIIKSATLEELSIMKQAIENADALHAVSEYPFSYYVCNWPQKHVLMLQAILSLQRHKLHKRLYKERDYWNPLDDKILVNLKLNMQLEIAHMPLRIAQLANV
jgi:hypothetical protein